MDALNGEVAVSGGLTASTGNVVLRTAGLTRSFGSVDAVRGLDVTVHAGEIYGFLGVNGAGKTTTIRMLMGIVKPDCGVIEILGEESRRTSIRQKRAIGYVSQEQNFYPWMTCRRLGEFVGSLYPTWDNQEFERLLRVLQVPPERKTSQLSGGTKVKLALALALAPRPALLILDEPTSGLDPVARREFLDIIQAQARDHGRTTFLSSHIIGEIERVADRVGIIHRGRMHYEGSIPQLRESVRAFRFAPGLPSLSRPDHLDQGPPPVITDAVEGLPFALPSDVKVLRDTVTNGTREVTCLGSPEFWSRISVPGVVVASLSMEDMFIAMVGTSPKGI